MQINGYASGLPLGFGDTGCVVGIAGENKKKIREPVEVDGDPFTNIFVPGKPDDNPFRPPADSPGEVEACSNM